MDTNNIKNNHLNLFHFFGQNGKQYLEDNLTRGLAICLENDPILLDRFLRRILKADYDNLFKVEGESSELIINVQQRAKKFEGIQTVFGVPLTTKELSFEIENEAKGAEDPITDLSIQIDDKLILIEVKRTAEDCRNQLQNQIQKMIETNDGNVAQNDVEEFSWGKLMELIRHTLKFEQEVSNVNLFTNDYYHFIKQQFPAWFENIPFSEISFPSNFDKEPKLKEHIEVRLNVIKNRMLELWNQEKGRDDELVFNRANIPVTEYSWVDEINIEPVQDEKNDENYMALKLWPGDTKTQGYSIFRSNKPFKWPDYIFKKEYKFVVSPYIKFSHMQGLCWVWSEKEKNPSTHKKDFFEKYSGKWKRNNQGKWVRKGAEWEDFDSILERVSPHEDWKETSGWNERVENSNRTYFYVSVGFAIEVRIPYSKIQEIDGKSQSDATSIANELKTLSEVLLKELDDQFRN